jgi:hypothetical protein
MKGEEPLANELMPNSSEAMGIWEPPVDEERREQETTERAKMASTVPIFEEMLLWFDTQIEAADSVKVVMKLKQERCLTLESAMHAADVVRGSLEILRDDFTTRFEQFMERDDG